MERIEEGLGESVSKEDIDLADEDQKTNDIVVSKQITGDEGLNRQSSMLKDKNDNKNS